MKKVLFVCFLGMVLPSCSTVEEKPKPPVSVDKYTVFYDFNGNGLLDSDEQDALAEFNRTHRIPEKVFDWNKDGVVTPEEKKAFTDALKKTPGVTIERKGIKEGEDIDKTL